MAEQRDDAVRKGAHCAWQIHYHMVFPVKYGKAVLDEAVMTMIQETAAEIAASDQKSGSVLDFALLHRLVLVWGEGFDSTAAWIFEMRDADMPNRTATVVSGSFGRARCKVKN